MIQKLILRNIIALVFIALFSCQIKPNHEEANTPSIKVVDNNQILSNALLSKRIVEDFYSWYINDIYLKGCDTIRVAPYKKYDENIYGLDVDSYKLTIKEIKYFTKDFKKQLITRCVECNESMLEENWDSDPNYEGSFNIPSCSYRWNNEWFGSQEDLNNKFTILDSVIIEDTDYTYFVLNYIGDSPAFKFKVKTILEEGEYKIASINRQ